MKMGSKRGRAHLFLFIAFLPTNVIGLDTAFPTSRLCTLMLAAPPSIDRSPGS